MGVKDKVADGDATVRIAMKCSSTDKMYDRNFDFGGKFKVEAADSDVRGEGPKIPFPLVFRPSSSINAPFGRLLQ